MNLREYLRNEWSQYIRPIIIKDKCEFCGCDDELHLHHIDRFHNLLVETLEELMLQELDTYNYNELELKQISNFMLAKQLKSEYKTLCRSCHIILHNKEKYSEEYKNHYYNPNGSYIQLNDELFTIDLNDNTLSRFIKICCNTTYDGYLKDNNRKAIINGSMLAYLKDFLNLGKSEASLFLNECYKFELLKLENKHIKINTNYVTKGFSNFINPIKIFDNNYNELYDRTNSRHHKTIGNIIRNYQYGNVLYNPNNFVKNITNFKNNLNDVYNLAKLVDKNIIYNPNIMYSGGLDYSYKSAIEEYNKIE